MTQPMTLESARTTDDLLDTMRRAVAAAYDTRLYSNETARGHRFVVERRFTYSLMRRGLPIEVTYMAAGSLAASERGGTAITYTITGDWGMQLLRLIPYSIISVIMLLLIYTLATSRQPLISPLIAVGLGLVVVALFAVFVLYLRRDFTGKRADFQCFVSELVQK